MKIHNIQQLLSLGPQNEHSNFSSFQSQPVLYFSKTSLNFFFPPLAGLCSFFKPTEKKMQHAYFYVFLPAYIQLICFPFSLHKASHSWHSSMELSQSLLETPYRRGRQENRSRSPSAFVWSIKISVFSSPCTCL